MDFKEFHSTYSNLAYFIAGAVVFTTTSFHSWYFFMCMILLTIGSSMYHATKRWDWQKADEIAMYAVFLALIFKHFYEFSPEIVGNEYAYWAMPLLGTIFVGFFHKNFDSFQTIFLLFWIDFGFIVMYRPTELVWTIFILGVVAVSARYFGQHYKNGKHEDWIHGLLWHPMTAVLLALMY